MSEPKPSALRLDGGRANRVDVVIAGAGLAGSTLALLLARAGARVALLDHARFPRDKLCGEFLSPECWGVLERLGLAPAVERLGYHAIRRARLTTPRGRMIEAPLTDRGGRPGIGLSRAALDELIVREARAVGAEIFEGVRVIGPVVHDGRVVGIVARRGADDPFERIAAVTVAADGRQSALVPRTGTTLARHRLGPRMFGLKRHLILGRADEDRDAEPAGTVGLHLVAGGYVGVCRIEFGLANLCGLLPEILARQCRGDLDRLADEVFSRNPALGRLWSSARPVGAWKTVSGVRVEASRPSLPGILYAGDCQGTIDPLGGQGMTMALLGAEMLAPLITRSLANPNRGADAKTQAAYHAAWHRRFSPRIRLCRAFHHILINPSLIDTLSTVPPLARRLLTFGYDCTRDSDPEPS